MKSSQIPEGALLTKVPLTIANGQQVSNVIETKGMSLIGVQIPTFTGTALTFESCDDLAGTNPVPVKSTIAGTVLTYTVASNGYYIVAPDQLAGIEFLRVKSGTAEGGARTLLASLRGVL